MEQKDKISVIITAYNVEAYADECIKSVLQQTYHNLEIIIIDDGSTDQSGKIFDRWAEKDARIKVIHQQNSGPANARNKALQYVTGDYVGFVDGDDVAFPEMYDELLRYLKKKKLKSVVAVRKRIPLLYKRIIIRQKKRQLKHLLPNRR